MRTHPFQFASRKTGAGMAAFTPELNVSRTIRLDVFVAPPGRMRECCLPRSTDIGVANDQEACRDAATGRTIAESGFFEPLPIDSLITAGFGGCRYSATPKGTMLEKVQTRPELFLLLSLLLVIVIYPLLDQDDFRRLVLGGLMFVPLILATVRLSRVKTLDVAVDPADVGKVDMRRGEYLLCYTALVGIKWGMLAAFFGLTVAGLFSYLRSARAVTNAHLYTAVCIYLLLGMLWFALDSAIDTVYPGAILSSSAATDRPGELLYFSLVTLSTIGYGDVVPRHGEVRMLAALEGLTGVLYVAIMVAILINAYKQQSKDSQ
jgi:hypothetical protein